MLNLIYRFKLILIPLCIIILSANNLKAETINKIIVEGNDRVSTETVIMFSGVSLNDDLSEDNLNLVLKQLYGSNFFELVSVKIKNLIGNDQPDFLEFIVAVLYRLAHSDHVYHDEEDMAIREVAKIFGITKSNWQFTKETFLKFFKYKFIN